MPTKFTLVSGLLLAVAMTAAGNPEENAHGAISAVWANDGGDKVTRDELRSETGRRPVLNTLWDGKRIRLFGARNEVLGFNVVLEASKRPARGVRVSFEGLSGPGATLRASSPADYQGLFRWRDREIELFLVRYLRIEGLSTISYETYDERHIPERFRRPGARGGWTDRPDHDREYPDIAVPMELAGDFSIEARTNQSVWIDVFIPKGTPAGLLTGTLTVTEGGAPARHVPVELEVRDFELPDVPASKTMLFLSYENIASRYAGTKYPDPGSREDRLAREVIARHLALAHRHKIALVGGSDAASEGDAPSRDWAGALRGDLFSPANGYAGPGAMTGIGVFSIGTYGSWQGRWGTASEMAMWQHLDRWQSWFRAHRPDVERFLYLADESPDHAALERWAGWIRRNPGPGREIRSFATASLLKAESAMPSLDLVASTMAVGERAAWQAAFDRLRADHRKQLILYNGQRPASGSFATEDDGVALRELPWGQYKKGIDRWFFWESTYYDDYQGGRGETNVFRTAQVFGGRPKPHASFGQAGWNYGNGNGVLFYPGTDRLFPGDSYGLPGPIASLRLKHWRRGIQDVDYLTLAHAVNPEAVKALVDRIVPKVLWENGVDDVKDPSWVSAPISWSTDPDHWERARAMLADLIAPRRAASRP